MMPRPPALTRRRFLAISAAALTSPVAAGAAPLRWHGMAMGAEVSLSLHAPRPLAEAALRATRSRLREIEHLFSLYDPASTLSALNRDGTLPAPPPLFRDLIAACDRMVAATGRVFDPSVQSLWHALARGTGVRAARETVGWDRIARGAEIRLAPGQQITLNGIAQGFATDLIRADLAGLGLRHALINIGEFAALGGPFTLGLSDPDQGVFATRRLSGGAIATSSPGAMQLAGGSHILHADPARTPRWSTVSVQATSATVADAASTAFTLMNRDEIARSLRRMPIGTRATLLAKNGDLETL